MRRLPALAAMLASALTVAVLAAPSSADTRQSNRPHWRVTLSVDSAQATVGKKVHLHGQVAKAAAGLLVVLQERRSRDVAWKVQRNALVHQDGTYRTYDTPTVNRARFYRVVMPATAHHRKGVSPSVRVVPYEWQDLTSMPSVNAEELYPVSSVAINGTTYPASLKAYIYQDGATSQSIEFNLDHLCSKFRGRFGLSDDSETDSQASVTATADGTAWFTGTFGLGQSTADAETWPTPPLKVRFDAESLVDGADGFGAVATPQVFCTQ